MNSSPSTVGLYEPDWDSLISYGVPEWMLDAKFGLRKSGRLVIQRLRLFDFPHTRVRLRKIVHRQERVRVPPTVFCVHQVERFLL